MKAPSSQGHTIECISKKPKDLQQECRHQLLRVAELQSEDFHMDRPLYYACRDDRERLCPKTKAGDGKVFRCLFRHKFDRLMTSEVVKV